MRGGKREGAGRPLAPPRPKPYSLRLETQEQHDKLIRLGGAHWLRDQINQADEQLKHKGK